MARRIDSMMAFRCSRPMAESARNAARAAPAASSIEDAVAEAGRGRRGGGLRRGRRGAAARDHLAGDRFGDAPDVFWAETCLIHEVSRNLTQRRGGAEAQKSRRGLSFFVFLRLCVPALISSCVQPRAGYPSP
jgi:hypothetical protein